MKDGDKTVIAYNIMRYTRDYWPMDKVANRIRMGRILGECFCADPKIMFPKVYHTAELKWSNS
jgi:hypothetical protein